MFSTGIEAHIYKIFYEKFIFINVFWYYGTIQSPTGPHSVAQREAITGSAGLS